MELQKNNTGASVQKIKQPSVAELSKTQKYVTGRRIWKPGGIAVISLF